MESQNIVDARAAYASALNRYTEMVLELAQSQSVSDELRQQVRAQWTGCLRLSEMLVLEQEKRRHEMPNLPRDYPQASQ